ncbi:MAG: chitobiase/beta-hexosaminidase C-terminal domain-containing protein [Tannerella sp.]|jgi:hypothetical protein|nr:chitobiase/beta-hexosaminidase C-terminal domain-containing protein [Tannerella sp.]
MTLLLWPSGIRPSRTGIGIPGEKSGTPGMQDERAIKMNVTKVMVWLIIFVSLAHIEKANARDIYVSPDGNDHFSGSKEKPFLTFERVMGELIKFAGKEPVNIWFAEGDYYVGEVIRLTPEYAGTRKNPVRFSSLDGHRVRIKGSVVLDALKWEACPGGIFVSHIPEELDFDQLFINGIRQMRARFPDYDEENPLRGGKGYLNAVGGTDERYDQWFLVDSGEFTKKSWRHPETGIVHAFQSHNWGNLQYRITSVDTLTGKISVGEGGWQMQRSHGIGKGSPFYIENIFEELDAPSEWFLDKDNHLLYFYPSAEVHLDSMVVEVPVVKDMIRLEGDREHPVRYVSFNGFNFTQSRFSFLESYEPVSLGDWAIHRGGVIFMEGVEHCRVTNCSFAYIGGNGIFMSAYNRENEVSGCYFSHTGESAVCLVGSPEAVRLYRTWEAHDRISPGALQDRADTRPGPKTPDYPEKCVVKNCIMHDLGDMGKQVSGVFISKSYKVSVSHCTVYNCPRTGICINDGTWGGHIIEHCDMWETVRETGEHGPFNAWGRERFWTGLKKPLVKSDAIAPTIIRNNRIANFRKSISAGNWTIDLDDGSSYYEIYNNLNLGSTIKLRDGFFRKVYNNICVGAVPLGWHVWPEHSEDEIYRNIIVISGAVAGSNQPTAVFVRPIELPDATPWSDNYNYNTYWNINYKTNPFMTEGRSFPDWQAQGYDMQSTVADPLFVNPEKGDYRVKENSPALKLGFKNFPMDRFGHRMTRIEPYGGEFTDEIRVTIRPDARMEAGGSLRYTLDGSAPTRSSSPYEIPFTVNQSCTVKALSFDKHGNPLGFVCEAKFHKTAYVYYPNWYKTLLADHYESDAPAQSTNAVIVEFWGAAFINMADDPDLIDASGGHNSGCYIKSIDPEKGKIWKDAGFESGWIILKTDGKEVRNSDDLKRHMNTSAGKIMEITATRNNQSKLFNMQLK